jgi:excinuclease ABC subunit C
MLNEADSVSFKQTNSVLEALLLEAELIKKWEPPYNTEGKDGKSFNCVVITDEDFPRVLIIRQKSLGALKLKTSNLKLQTIHGPFPYGAQLQVVLKIIRKIFPYRDTCRPCLLPRNSAFSLRESAGCKPCFNRQIGLCPGVCTGEISKREYARTIRNLRLFLGGKASRLLRVLEKEMKEAAKREEFEVAEELKRQLFALQHIQDVALLTGADSRGWQGGFSRKGYAPSASIRDTIRVYPRLRVEAYDLSHFGGKDIVGAMAVVENGEVRKSEYRLFRIKRTRGIHETAGLMEILERRFNHPEWQFPDLIVVDGNTVQKVAAEKMLFLLGKKIHVIALVKDERHRPRELLGDRKLSIAYRHDILLANSEAHRFALKFQRRRRVNVKNGTTGR